MFINYLEKITSLHLNTNLKLYNYYWNAFLTCENVCVTIKYEKCMNNGNFSDKIIY